jgi:hypothetical protein
MLAESSALLVSAPSLLKCFHGLWFVILMITFLKIVLSLEFKNLIISSVYLLYLFSKQ